MRAKTLNEMFDILNWSKANLPKYVSDQIESVFDGNEGEAKQTSLLKVNSKNELIDWFNKNFELGALPPKEIKMT